MSYDLQIWSVKRPSVESDSPRGLRWTQSADSMSVVMRDWQITVEPADLVHQEDIPVDVASALPGIRYLTELNLQPFDASNSAKATLVRIASAVAKASHGLVYDPQTDELITPRGVKRFIPQARDERFSIIELGFWFLDVRIFSPDHMEGFLDLCDTLLPEALPRRYGLYEPPQYVRDVRAGRAHLLTFLHENLDGSPVLYTTRPVLGLGFSCTKERYHPRNGFRSNYVSVEIEASVIQQPGWQEQLRRFWVAICRHLNPFYSDVRTLKGYVRMGGTYGSDHKSEEHPIRSWFWRGVPGELGHAIAIGEPYIDLWPQASMEGERHGDLIVLDTCRWVDGDNLTIKVPGGIRQKSAPKYLSNGDALNSEWLDEYPDIWPFVSN